MLSDAKNKLLTEVGPGTPMGGLLRCYWHPVGAVSEMARTPIKPLRIMGENLVLYRDLGGNYGLLDRQCAHRRADLAYGFVEQNGLRCHYHGWVYDNCGKCLEQPYDDIANPQARLKDKITLKSYPVEALGGLLWAYLGPQPAPLVPNWEPFTWKNGFVQIVFAEVPCNWLQAQENSIDPVHFEWAHMNWSVRLRGAEGPYSPRHIKLDFAEFEYGFQYKRLRENMREDDPLWTVGRVCLWPNILFLGDHFEWRVPIDDENMLSVTWAFNRVPKEREPYVQGEIPSWHGPVKDPATGRWITSHVMNQDFIAWAGQGRIADRTRENLGASDRGIALLRQRFFSELDAVARGAEPKATIRDPEVNRCVSLPVAGRKMLVDGLTRAEMKSYPGLIGHLDRFPFQAGQPEEVRRAFRKAMGVEGEPATPPR